MATPTEPLKPEEVAPKESEPNLAETENPDAAVGNEEEGDEDLGGDVAPLRMHVRQRLSASGSILLVPPTIAGGGGAGGAGGGKDSSSSAPASSSSASSAGRHTRRTSLERRKSRSHSPSIRAGTATTVSSTLDGNSSLSSLEDVDSDILTDKLGLAELDAEKLHSSAHQLHIPPGTLTPVSERLCDETLEDSHAFSDVKTSGTHSRGTSSIATGGDVGSLLETLEEECEDDEPVDEEGDKVILTNMENITIHEVHEDDDEVDALGTPREDLSSTAPTT